MANPPPSSPRRLSAGHAGVLEEDLRMPAGVVVAEDVRRTADPDTPGVSLGTTIIDCWRCRGASGSVLPITMRTRHRGRSAPDENHFVPLSTYSLPSRVMRSPMFVASDDATSGSVIENAERISPSSNGASQSRLTVSDP